MPTTTSYKASNNNTNIKGGGRASLSDDVEKALIDYLRKRQRTTDQSLSRKNDSNESSHDAKRERKRYVKRLVARYQREKVQRQLNGIVPTEVAEEEEEDNADARKGKITSSTTEKSSSSLLTDSTSGDAVSGKVRVDLVEAVFTEGNSNKSSSSSSNKKKHSPSLFKSGAKKTMVLPRATTVNELLPQGQAKLRMKKKPVRVFVMTSPNRNQVPVDLTTNLVGVADGTTLYITTTPSSSSSSKSTNIKDEEEEEEEEKNKDEFNDSSDDKVEPSVDPLEAVKQIYAQQQYQRSRRRHRPQATKNVTFPIPHPTFSNHFHSLPALSEYAKQLPAANSRNELLQAVEEHRVVVICGATGCGKSTQVPQFLWQGMQAISSAGTSSGDTIRWKEHANIVVTQPRRIAATTLARRVSQELGAPLPGQQGSLVGHHVRLDQAVANTARVVYCTVGILLRQLLSPITTSDNKIPLDTTTHVVVDEVHERDVNTDFLLTLLRGVVLPQNPNIRIILMSATASAQLFVDYFASYEPVVLTIPGRTFPVETKWLLDCQQMTSQTLQHYHDQLKEDDNIRTGKSENSQVQLSPRSADPIDNSFIQSLIAAIVRQQESNGELSSTTDTKYRTNGAILVFLPGKAEIESLFRVLIRGNKDVNNNFLNIYRLHSGMPHGAQQTVFEPAASGTVKVVLATNIAETSITIADVSHVIDTGRVKESRYNSETRIKELVTVWTSQASAKQRAGRAGRTTAGYCYRLYTSDFCDKYLLDQTPPEMVRTPLDELILQFCLLYEQRRDQQTSLESFPKGANPTKFLSQVPEPPPTSSLEQACQHLLDVDALHVVDAKNKHNPLYRLTPLGFHLSRLPMDAKVGKTLIVGCLLGCLDGALTVAATLSSTKSCFYFKFGGGNGNGGPGKKPIVDRDYELATEARDRLIEDGFGGKDWKGGTVKGDLIAAIACFRAWAKRSKDQDRFDFAVKHALNHIALKEIQELRRQYLDLLVDAGFVSSLSKKNAKLRPENRHQDDALLTSCCLVAGLYPNVCTLMRPRKGGPKGGRLLTKENDSCRPQTQSFQRSRVQKAAESGKDAYAVYHTKHRSVGTGNRVGEVFLNQVDFVSRYALLLFSGELEIVENAVILDGWLKFKIGDKSMVGAVLLSALRDELDQSLLRQISNNSDRGMDELHQNNDNEDDDHELMTIVRQLLASE